LPLGALIAVAVWAIDLAVKAVLPVLAWLPDRSIGGVSLAVLVALSAVIGSCFVAGLLAETALVRGLGRRAERLATMIPGYALMKSVGTNLAGIDGGVRTVVVRFEATCQLGFLMETLPDGRQLVFVPGVPRAMVGTLHIVAPERVEPLNLSVSTALDVLGRLGVGLSESWPREVVSRPT
jgi:uncharacterized membrane protein